MYVLYILVKPVNVLLVIKNTGWSGLNDSIREFKFSAFIYSRNTRLIHKGSDGRKTGSRDPGKGASKQSNSPHSLSSGSLSKCSEVEKILGPY